MKKTPDKSIVIVMGGIYCGGAERVATYLMKHWNQKGWDIKLITMQSPDKDYYHVPDEVTRIVIKFGGTSGNKLVGLSKNIPFIWKLRKELKRSEAKHVLAFLTRTNIHTILASVGLGKRVIISERNDTTVEEHLWPWPALRKMVYRFADVVTANSEIALSGMKEYVAEEKLKIVPNPVYMPEEPANPAISHSILNVGRLVPQKAQHLLIEALALLGNEKLDNWKLNILGIGEEEERLKNITKEKGLSDKVRFHGWIDDVAPMYQKGGIFVLSSMYEGTPNALLEAMSYGLPCIISDTLPGAMKLVENGKTGLIFSSGGVDDLAEKLWRLMEDPKLRNRLGKNARDRVRNYAPENVIPVWESLI